MRKHNYTIYIITSNSSKDIDIPFNTFSDAKQYIEGIYKQSIPKFIENVIIGNKYYIPDVAVPIGKTGHLYIKEKYIKVEKDLLME